MQKYQVIIDILCATLQTHVRHLSNCNFRISWNARMSTKIVIQGFIEGTNKFAIDETTEYSHFVGAIRAIKSLEFFACGQMFKIVVFLVIFSNNYGYLTVGLL